MRRVTGIVYNLFRLDRTALTRNGYIKCGGGILIYVKNMLTASLMYYDACISTSKDAEIYTVCIKFPHTRPLYVITLYRPPDSDILECIKKLQTFCDSLPNRHLCDIISGVDFNIDYRKSSSDKSKLLKTFMKKNTLLQIIDAPTRPLYNEAIIDLILTNTTKA